MFGVNPLVKAIRECVKSLESKPLAEEKLVKMLSVMVFNSHALNEERMVVPD